MQDRQLVANRIITPDGTTLQSYYGHDFKVYTDANGKEYMVDGGLEYTRRNVHDDAPYTEDSVYSDDPFDKIRVGLHWGTYGKNGDQPRRWVPLCSMSNNHIAAILETQHHIPDWLRGIFETEQELRLKEGINIED